jgi:hypothetical protein
MGRRIGSRKIRQGARNTEHDRQRLEEARAMRENGMVPLNGNEQAPVREHERQLGSSEAADKAISGGKF